MSDLQSKQLAAELLRQTLAKKHTPGNWHLWLGVLYPAAVIAFELATRWCAQSFFDPMPTVWHTLGVAAVPAGNLFVWLSLRDGPRMNPKWLALANGIAIGIGGFYTLIFLPLLPLAVIAVVFYGIGLLPMAPLVALISTVKLASAFRIKHAEAAFGRQIAGGVMAGLALLIALDIPAAATRLGVQWAASGETAERERGLSLLRTLGDDDLLLRLCYDAAGRPSGLLSALVIFGGGSLLEPQQRQFAQSTSEIREIYYRVNGVPFNTKPAPFDKGTWARFADFQFDADHGGTEVGGRIKGLDLVSSRIDGSIDAADATSYLEWIVEFRNTSPQDREARVQFALPPGGVVSRTTLWVNGEEREAAYGGRGAVRAAYQRVAVQQRRDPLLVTTKGADRVLAQAFPVPRNGTLKFKIGITAPLDLADPAKGRLVLPAIVDRNFSFEKNVQHSIWLESKTALTASAPGLTASEISPGLFRVLGSLDDAALARTRQTVSAARGRGDGPVLAQSGGGDKVVQDIAKSTAKVPGALMIVIDGSARVAGTADNIIGALDKIPEGVPVGLLMATGPAAELAIAPWTQEHKRAAGRLIATAHFNGGQDNTPALASALMSLEKYDGAALLWVHGPQPINFRSTASLLEQAGTRLVRRPQVWLYATEPGPNELLPDLPWAWSAKSLPQTGAASADLSAFFAQTLAPREMLTIHRDVATATADTNLPQGSEHIARLWARDRVLALMNQNGEGHRDMAVALASQYHLVTPVSGAVVLETQQQYDESRLTPVTKASVPTVPEPEEWALILLSAGAFLWLMRRSRPKPSAMAMAVA